MFKWLLIILLLIIAVLGGAFVWLYSRAAVPVPQNMPRPVEQMRTEPNVTVIVHQSAVNDMLAAIFPIEGQGKMGMKPLLISYTWRVLNPRVEMTPEGATLSVEAQLHVLGKTHSFTAQGSGTVRYDSTERELYMDLKELRANTSEKILGIPLDRLNLAPSNLSVRLLSHLPLLTDFKVKKPNDVREEVQFAIVGHRVHFEKQRAIVDFAVRFKEESQTAEPAGQQSQNK
jgi:hypothetical protein